MCRRILFALLAAAGLVLSLAGCGGTEAPPETVVVKETVEVEVTAVPEAESPVATPTAVPATPVPATTVPGTAAPTDTPEVTPSPTYPPDLAGADFFALDFRPVGGDEEQVMQLQVEAEAATEEEEWLQLIQATNRSYCAFAFQFQLEVEEGSDLMLQWPLCIELTASGTGTFTMTVRPDATGYNDADTVGNGLAWWPAGNNGIYNVDGLPEDLEEWPELTTGSEGVDFVLEGPARAIVIRLEDGYLTMPLGEIRNNVMPVW